MGTGDTSASFYIARAIESIQDIKDLRYQVTPMGTILEAQTLDKIFEATKQMSDTVHNLSVNRVEIVIKIDSRKDKHVKMEEKLDTVNKLLKSF
jgi:uncharacterized protein (TIGR00106 family)